MAMFAAPAAASFWFGKSFESALVNEDGSVDVRAGSHPFAFTTGFKFNRIEIGGFTNPDGDARDIEVELPPGLVGDPNATPKCTVDAFLRLNQALPLIFNAENDRLEASLLTAPSCTNETQVGVVEADIELGGVVSPVTVDIYNLVPPAGAPAEFGIDVGGVPVLLTPRVRTGTDYGLDVASYNTSQALRLFGIKTTFWGVPADSSHDGSRGECL